MLPAVRVFGSELAGIIYGSCEISGAAHVRSGCPIRGLPERIHVGTAGVLSFTSGNSALGGASRPACSRASDRRSESIRPDPRWRPNIQRGSTLDEGSERVRSMYAPDRLLVETGRRPGFRSTSAVSVRLATPEAGRKGHRRCDGGRLRAHGRSERIRRRDSDVGRHRSQAGLGGRHHAGLSKSRGSRMVEPVRSLEASRNQEPEDMVPLARPSRLHHCGGSTGLHRPMKRNRVICAVRRRKSAVRLV